VLRRGGRVTRELAEADRFALVAEARGRQGARGEQRLAERRFLAPGQLRVAATATDAAPRSLHPEQHARERVALAFTFGESTISGAGASLPTSFATVAGASVALAPRGLALSRARFLRRPLGEQLGEAFAVGGREAGEIGEPMRLGRELGGELRGAGLEGRGVEGSERAREILAGERARELGAAESVLDPLARRGVEQRRFARSLEGFAESLRQLVTILRRTRAGVPARLALGSEFAGLPRRVLGAHRRFAIELELEALDRFERDLAGALAGTLAQRDHPRLELFDLGRRQDLLLLERFELRFDLGEEGLERQRRERRGRDARREDDREHRERGGRREAQGHRMEPRRRNSHVDGEDRGFDARAPPRIVDLGCREQRSAPAGREVELDRRALPESSAITGEPARMQRGLRSEAEDRETDQPDRDRHARPETEAGEQRGRPAEGEGERKVGNGKVAALSAPTPGQPRFQLAIEGPAHSSNLITPFPRGDRPRRVVTSPWRIATNRWPSSAGRLARTSSYDLATGGGRTSRMRSMTNPSRRRAFLLLLAGSSFFAGALLAPRDWRVDLFAGGDAIAPRPVHPRATPLETDEQSTVDLFERASQSVAFIAVSRLRPEVIPFTHAPTGSDLEAAIAGLRQRWRRAPGVLELPPTADAAAWKLAGAAVEEAFAWDGGSGVVWDDQGHVVTNYHVVEGHFDVLVRLPDLSEHAARVVGFDEDKDLAVLAIESEGAQLVPIAVGTSSDLRVGQRVYSIGNPFGLSSTLTGGLLSAIGRTIRSGTGRGNVIQDVLQTDAAINPGNSGGPLLDSEGRLIGVTTAIVGDAGGNAGIGFAIPVDTVNRIVPELLRHGQPIKAALGILVMTELGDKIDGVAIEEVLPGGPAALAGMRGGQLQGSQPFSRGGDVIVAIDGEAVHGFDDLFRILDRRAPGDVVELTYRRGEQQSVASVALRSLTELRALELDPRG
jgi:S1-C subfamily serine protease